MPSVIKTEMWGFPITLPIPGTNGVDVGDNSDGCVFGKLTRTALDAVYQVDGGVYTDYTTQAGAATGNVLIVPTTDAAGDIGLFGHTAPFTSLAVNVGTAAVETAAIANEAEWIYYDEDGSASALTTNDASTLLSAGTSTYVVSFNPPSDWAPYINSNVDKTPRYWIGYRIKDATLGTSPVLSQVWCTPTNSGTGLVVQVGGNVKKVFLNCATHAGTTADSKFLVINATKGTFASFTWTKTTKCLEADLSTTLGFDTGDEIVLQQVAEDGSAEVIDGSVTLLMNLF